MKKSKISEMERLLRAVADTTRLRLLNLMGDQEICVCYFVEVLKMSQPKISRHLAYLRKAGIVTARRDGKWMHYRIANPLNEAAARILADVQSWLKDDREIQNDQARMSKACCRPEGFVTLKGAPQPVTVAHP